METSYVVVHWSVVLGDIRLVDVIIISEVQSQEFLQHSTKDVF